MGEEAEFRNGILNNLEGVRPKSTATWSAHNSLEDRVHSVSCSSHIECTPSIEKAPEFALKQAKAAFALFRAWE